MLLCKIKTRCADSMIESRDKNLRIYKIEQRTNTVKNLFDEINEQFPNIDKEMDT